MNIVKNALMYLVVYGVSPVIFACAFTGITPWELLSIVQKAVS